MKTTKEEAFDLIDKTAYPPYRILAPYLGIVPLIIMNLLYSVELLSKSGMMIWYDVSGFKYGQ